jgi:amino acid transporter
LRARTSRASLAAMHHLTVTFAVLLALCLVHVSYVDFRFRHRGSVMWFWLARPAPPLLIISRAALVLCLLSAIAISFVGATKLMAIIITSLMLIHIGTLIAVEIREDHWPPPKPRD